MFYTSAGWLHYAPFKDYALPTIEKVTHNGPSPVFGTFERKHEDGTEKSHFRLPLYRLRWPGVEGDHSPKIPWEILRHWPTFQLPDNEKYDCSVCIPYSLPELFNNSQMLDNDKMPDLLAYHLAVNYERYSRGADVVLFDVAGLPKKAVQGVLEAEFALDAKTLATLQYIKWLAEGHRAHPLFQGFDTLIRDSLTEINAEAVRQFFHLLFDHEYDHINQWWTKWAQFPVEAQDPQTAPVRHRTDWRYATYLHWVGRTGQGLYQTKAQMDKRDREVPPEVGACLYDWFVRKMGESRKMMHESGGDPGVIPSQGITLTPASKDFSITPTKIQSSLPICVVPKRKSRKPKGK